MNTPIFIISFLRRYWKLLIVFVVVVLLGKIDQVTYFVGPVFFLAEMAVASIVAALFVRHIFFTKTLDAFSQHGNDGSASPFDKTWNSLTDYDRLQLSLIMLSVFFLGVCWIAANLAK